MKQILKNFSLSLIVLGSLVACTPSAKQMTELLEKNPEILVSAIEKNPEKIMTAIQKAARSAQENAQENATKEEQNRRAEEMKNPLQPEVNPARGFMGPASAPVTIVEYTDFQCPYCSRGYSTLEEVRKHYGDKVKVLVKNLPLPMHPLAMPAAKRFEALRLQSTAKAEAFYHEIFPNQQKLNADGEKYLDSVVKKVGGDLAQVKKDMDSTKVEDAIKADVAEAEKYGIQGTPGFIINGVSLRGAYPADAFKEIIDAQLASK